jgi:hypothetical protein
LGFVPRNATRAQGWHDRQTERGLDFSHFIHFWDSEAQVWQVDGMPGLQGRVRVFQGLEHALWVGEGDGQRTSHR